MIENISIKKHSDDSPQVGGLIITVSIIQFKKNCVFPRFLLSFAPIFPTSRKNLPLLVKSTNGMRQKPNQKWNATDRRVIIIFL